VAVPWLSGRTVHKLIKLNFKNRQTIEQLELYSSTIVPTHFTMSTKKMPKKVSFAPSARVRLVPELSEFTREDMEKLWMLGNEEEVSRGATVSDVVAMRRLFKKGCSIDAILSRGEEDSSGDETCFRGIEHMVTSTVAREKKSRRIRSIRAVLIEQERQRKMGENESTLLASVYFHATKHARDRAIKDASGDLNFVIDHVLPAMKIDKPHLMWSLPSLSKNNEKPHLIRPSSPLSEKRTSLSRSESSPIDTDEMLPDVDRSNHSHAHHHRPPKANDLLQQNFTALEMQVPSKVAFVDRRRRGSPSSTCQCQRNAKTA